MKNEFLSLDSKRTLTEKVTLFKSNKTKNKEET